MYRIRRFSIYVLPYYVILLPFDLVSKINYVIPFFVKGDTIPLRKTRFIAIAFVVMIA